MEIEKWRNSVKTVAFLDMVLAVCSVVVILIAICIRIHQETLTFLSGFGMLLTAFSIAFWQFKSAWSLAKAAAKQTDPKRGMKLSRTWKIVSFLLLLLYVGFIIPFFIFVVKRDGVEFTSEGTPILIAFLVLCGSFIFRVFAMFITYRFTSLLTRDLNSTANLHSLDLS